MMSNYKNRFDHIDSMRAIAALLVVWHHTAEEFVKIAQPSIQDGFYTIANFFDLGRIGVVIFFAISGFVIPSSLSGNKMEGTRSFLIKRFFRMYPLYWLSIPLGFITSWYIWNKDIATTSILWNFTMLQEAAGHPSIEGLYWTLQTELVFYALCLTLFLVGALRSVWILSVLAFIFTAAHLGPLILSVVGLHIPSIPSPSLATMSLNLGVMFWGALFRAWIDKRPFPSVAKIALIGYVAAWCVFLAYAIKMLAIGEAHFKLLAPYAIGVFLFAGLAIFKKPTCKLLVWAGTISYSIYLFHPVIMYTLSRIVQASGIEWIKGWPTGSYMLLTLLATFLFSAFTYRYIESPAIRLGVILSKRPSDQAQHTAINN